MDGVRLESVDPSSRSRSVGEPLEFISYNLPMEVVGQTLTFESGRLYQAVAPRIRALKVPARGEDENTVVHGYISQCFAIIEDEARTQKRACNKWFHEANDEIGKRPDYVVTLPNERTYYDFNTLCFVEMKAVAHLKKSGAKIGKVKRGPDVLLRQGICQAIYRLVARYQRTDYSQKFGYAFVCNGVLAVLVRVDFSQAHIPVYISAAVPFVAMESALGAGMATPDGLCALLSLLCTTSPENFGLPTSVMRPPAGYTYVRALGQGGFADVAVVADATGRELVCKAIRNRKYAFTLETEAELLEKLHIGDASVGVPTLVGKIYDGETLSCILLAEVGTPLLQFLKSNSELTSLELADYVRTSLRNTLDRAHSKGLIHGDIRPSNIILYVADSSSAHHVRTWSDYRVLLCDWGLGRMSEQGVSPRSKRPMGCATFMANALLQGTATVVESSHDLEALTFTYYAIRDGALGNPPWPHAFSYTDQQTVKSG